jgi:O-antigen ligase
MALGKHMLEQLSFFTFTDHLRQQIIRLGSILGIFAAAVAGLFWNIAYMLRVGIGSLVVLAFLRYPFLLLLAWALIDAFIGSTLTFFQGKNFDLGLTIATLLVLASMPIKASLRRMPALAFLGIYLAWVFAGIGISPLSLGPFLTQWLLILDYLMVSVIVINVLTTQRHLNRCIDAILLVSTFISGYGIYGYITRQHGVTDASSQVLFRIASTFGDVPPSLAFFLSIVIPLAMYRALTSSGFARIVSLVVVLVALVALALTFTRSAFISFPLSVLLVVPFLPSRKLRRSFFTSIVGLALVIVLLAGVAQAPIFDRFFSQDITTLNGRTYLWNALLSHFDPTRLLGNGLDASNRLLAQLRVGYGGVIGSAPHNLFLGTLYDHGVIGVVLLIAVFLALAVILLTGVRRAAGNQRILFAMSLAIFINVFLQSFDASEIWNQASGMYFWISMALPFACCWSASGPPPQGDQGVLEVGTARHALATQEVTD